MDRLSYFVIYLCLFMPQIEGNVVCLRPNAPIDANITPEKRAYFSEEKVYITCETPQHRLFGADKWVCKDGNWKAQTSYCSKKTQKFKLKNTEADYMVLFDKNANTCLNISYFTRNGPVYIEIIGTHRIIIVDLKDKPSEYTRHHRLYLFKDYSRRHDYKDISNYERCITGPGTFIHYCDFIRPTKNPLILIEPGDEGSGCTNCQMCEITFYEVAEFPNEESTTELLNKESTTESPTEESIAEFPTGEPTKEMFILNSNMALIISLTTVGVIAGISLILSIFMILKVHRRKKKKENSEAKRKAIYQLEKEHEYEYVTEYRGSIQPQETERPSYERAPIYMSELVELSNSRLRDESGYLVPIKKNQNEYDVNRRNFAPGAGVNIYCRISEMSLKNPEHNS